MSVLSRLQSAGVQPVSDILDINCKVFEPAPGAIQAPPVLAAQANPLVSCLMTTRGNLDLMKYSLACYRRQTYANRELVIVAEPEAGEKVETFIAAQDVLNATVFVAPPGLAFGDHRNIATARSRGAVLVAWDDDDLADPRRLEVAVGTLRHSGAAAAFLSRLLVWWPRRKVAAISQRKPWEGTIAAWRPHMPLYPRMQRGEDTIAINALVNTHRVALVDCPFLYVYAVTGRNTWGPRHFEHFLKYAECLFEGDEFDELSELLSDRLPLLDYAAMLNDEGTVKLGG